MKIANGWDVFLKVKELSNVDSEEKTELHADILVRECGLKKELVKEYLHALSVLKFIEFTDPSREAFVISELGAEQ